MSFEAHNPFFQYFPNLTLFFDGFQGAGETILYKATRKLLPNITLLQPTNFSFPQNLSEQLRNIFLHCYEYPLTYQADWGTQNSQNVPRVIFPQKFSHQHVIHNTPNLCKFKNKLPLSISVNNLDISLQLIIVMGTRQRKSYTSLGKLLSKDAFDYMKQQSPSK